MRMMRRWVGGITLVVLLATGCARGDQREGGETRAGLTGPAGTGRQGEARDLGQQISDLVAAIDGVEAVGAGVPVSGGAGIGGPAGISTVVLGDEAFVGIDATTLVFSGKTGDMTGGVHGGLPAVGVPITGDPATRGAEGTTAPAAGGPPGAPSATGETAEFRQMIRSFVTVAFPQIREVYVTTDPVLVARIARVAGREEARAVEARAIADELRARSAR